MPNQSFFEGIKKEALVCAHCGYCRVGCPIYEQIGWESGSPRAKMSIASKLADSGHLSEQDISRIFQCTLCGKCRDVCSTRIDTLEVWKHLRECIVEKGEGPHNLKTLTQTIVENSNITGDEQENRELWMDSLEDEAYKQHVGRPGKVLYFTGCSGSLYPQVYGIPQAFVQILEKAGEDYTLLGAKESCCGFPLIAAGEPRKVKDQMMKNLEQIAHLGVDTVVTTCPSCYHTWRDTYPEILGKENSFKVMHSSQLIAQYIREGKLELHELNESVTYHDPCDLGRNSGVYDEPRFVLNAIPGLNFTEMNETRETSNCCGGGGNLEAVNAELTGQIAAKRIQDILDTGAQTVVSGCQQCKRTLQVNARKQKARVKVLDLTELVLKSINN